MAKKYIYTPNETAREVFNLLGDTYSSSIGPNPLMQGVIGKNFNDIVVLNGQWLSESNDTIDVEVNVGKDGSFDCQNIGTIKMVVS